MFHETWRGRVESQWAGRPIVPYVFVFVEDVIAAFVPLVKDIVAIGCLMCGPHKHKRVVVGCWWRADGGLGTWSEGRYAWDSGSVARPPSDNTVGRSPKASAVSSSTKAASSGHSTPNTIYCVSAKQFQTINNTKKPTVPRPPRPRITVNGTKPSTVHRICFHSDIQ